MAFRWFKKSDLMAGVILFGFLAVLFLAAAAFGDSIVSRMTVNGALIQKSDPSYEQKLWMWRGGMFAGFLFSTVLGWVSFRGLRRSNY